MDGDLSRVQAASTGDAWSTYRTEYQSAQDAGASMTGRYDLDIKFVSPITPRDIFATATKRYCPSQSSPCTWVTPVASATLASGRKLSAALGTTWDTERTVPRWVPIITGGVTELRSPASIRVSAPSA